MPRKNRRREDARPPRDGGGGGAPSSPTRREQVAGGEWYVRSVPGARAVKTYRCPGCDHEIRPGVPHVVAWPAGEYGSATDRRHWHTGCWQARQRRGR